MSTYISEALNFIIAETSTPELKETCKELQESLAIDPSSIENVVKELSEFILKIDNAKLFKKYLSNILLALVSAKIPLKPVFSKPDFDSCNDIEKINHLEYSIALAAVCEHPDILQYALKYFEINRVAPFEVFIRNEDSYNVVPKKRRLLGSRQKINDQDIVSCCYTLLSNLPNELSHKWDWTNFVNNFCKHQDAGVRWMVKECMAILTNMTEMESKILLDTLNIHPEVCHNIMKKSKEEVVRPLNGVLKCDMSPDTVVNVDGILLPVFEKTNVQTGNLVPVKSTVNNLRSLALAVASGQAICLMGPVGSGKTSLVEHLAAITGRKGVAFKKVQLGDQTDSRMLLGSHQCTDVPGEFVWRPGVLTEAVQNGHWLLLEDIDCAALDVASTLSSLLETNTLCVPGFRDSLPVTPGFQLFVTQRIITTSYGFQKKLSNSSTLLQKHLTQINVEPLSRTELGEIIQTQYPALTTICSRIIEVFMLFSVGSHDTSLQTTESVTNQNEKELLLLRGSRLISTRDLLKWCSRAVVDFNVSCPESALKVLQDALDIFTCSVAFPEHRLELAKKVGLLLGIVETKSEFYCKHHKPNVSLNARNLEVGRSKVPRIEKSLEAINFDNKQTVFSFTRQSACLLERIACCVTSNEPVLLVGETGTGKTSSVQYLAKQTGHKLVVINMNQQSDSADLLGGYKPVDMKYIIRPIKLQFEQLFKSFYNTEKNKKFLGHIDTCYETENWSSLVTLMKQSHKAAMSRLTVENKHAKLQPWLAFGSKLLKLEQQVKAASKLTFAFIEGSLVKAMQEGHWVLLDEINLASAEILECLAGLLEDKNETIDLLEKGDKVPIKRHPEFTLFACMNPATDVGKKDLPPGLRNRFTEFYIDELTERNDLMLLIGDYLYHMNLSGAVMEAIYSFYSNIRKEAKITLVDGSGNAPHYSLRTLCRALTAAAKAKCGTVSRSLYEAFCLSFLTQLDSSSHPKVEAMIAKAVIGKKNVTSVINQIIPEPQVLGQNYLLFEGHWIPQGKLEIAIPEDYILTPTVRKNLRDIARIISLGRLPILLQGDTSVGKTSLITYIAKASGNYCVRINNHEHTDLQEYIGSYASDSSGKLVFKEGVLVEAMRKGYWIILDELNLAPSDVLEALNRVLDDNRELFIPETQQVVKADPNFMLFATQNPPGLYGGRKMLSRAFRNRFVELHFDEIPKAELQTILHQRCHVPPAYSKKMIAVMSELQIRRRGSAAVQGKDGFITLRDLFRWGQRYKHASKESLTDEKFYDWDQHIADEGYLILAGKVRQTDERSIIEEVIEKHIKRKVDPNNLFSLHASTSPVTKSILETILNNQLQAFSHVVWTFNMRRLAVLIAKCFSFDEPVLLVGETGCGKTTICQVLAALNKRQLLTVNCHMHTESSDFLGGLRPVRQYKNDGRLFEWVDGPLIKAMETGDMFLADEISLADDSVLERMNSLLEPERQLVLAERGMEDNSDIVVITANKNFHFISTMNPGGDFGKKELSPALRNRFTEIWCDSVTSREDLLKVLEKSVNKGVSLGNQEDGSSGIGTSILDFTEWLKHSEVTSKFPFSIRDLLSWVHFINVTVAKRLLDTPEAYVHGACMTFLDCFGTALTGHTDSETLDTLRKTAIDFLLNQIKTVGSEYLESLKDTLSNKQRKLKADTINTKFGIDPFYIEVGERYREQHETFTFTAPTTGSNTLRLLRGLQLNKAILLEGNPGVGKTSLVTALAQSSGHKVVRINLSDQTDITDLFGTDLPTEDGSFTFKEGAFLSALQNGDWILLDELNLAPQPVLEGLNACLDHRGEVFIPELSKTFKVKQQTRIFACQNPLKQGGARRGLPISFLNRFTQVYIDTLTKEDLLHIVHSQYPTLCKDVSKKIVTFNCQVANEVTELQLWGHVGAPYEMNLRDIQRWCRALINDQETGKAADPGKYVDMLYVNRMRTAEDKEKMIAKYDLTFAPYHPRNGNNPHLFITDEEICIGDVSLPRSMDKTFKNRRAIKTNLRILRNQLPTLRALAQSVKMNWLSILVGATATGKSSIVQVLADLTGNELHVVPVTSAMDVSDLLGGFEQVDYNRNLESIFDKIETLTIQTTKNIWLNEEIENWKSKPLLSDLHQYQALQTVSSDEVTTDNMENFRQKIEFLLKHCDKLLKYTKRLSERTKLYVTITSLKKLQRKLSSMTSVNAGGKFEFVDSLLVKTMIEGSWLLLDNVNLCSAAVLDRLNGVLEPNGVLNIPERGDFGQIRPHPDFRVFFTMDPKYGEISRAMRNRGIEIFLLRPNDFNTNLSETVSYMDLTGLLSSCGLPGQYHEMCIKCHDLMKAYVRGFERPTISHLLQAAHLTWQQIVRGINVETAFISSFSDVYIKPRCGGDFDSNVIMSLAEMKKVMMQALTEAVTDQEYSKCIKTDHTLTIRGLCSNSSIEVAKQIAYVAVQASCNKSVSIFGSMFTTYQKASPELLEWIHVIVESSFKDQSMPSKCEFAKLLNDQSLQYLSRFRDLDTFNRFFQLPTTKTNKIYCISNMQSLLFYEKLLKAAIAYMQTKVSKKTFSVLDYSRAVLANDLTDDFVEYPILKYCQNYLAIIECYVTNSIKLATDDLSDLRTCRIMQALNWRSRLFIQLSKDIFVQSEGSRRQVLREDVIPLLYLHSKWMHKHLILPFADLSPENKKLFKEYMAEVKHIITNKDHANTPMTKISKKLRKQYGQPKLFFNKEEYDICCEKTKIYRQLSLDMGQPISKQLNKLCLNNYNVTDMNMALDVPNKETLAVIQENMSKQLDNDQILRVSPRVRLLPLVSYVIQRMFTIVQRDFIEMISQLTNVDQPKVVSKYSDVLVSLKHLGKVINGFPPALLNLIEVMVHLQDYRPEIIGRISSIPVKFWDEYYKSLVYSPAFYPVPFLTVQVKESQENSILEEVPINSERWSTSSALLPYYLYKFTISTDNTDSKHLLAYEAVSLEDRTDYSMQLGSVMNVLWKNIATLNTAASSKTISDGKFEMKKYEKLMFDLYFLYIKKEISLDYLLSQGVLPLLKHIRDENFRETLIKSHEVYTKLDCNIDSDGERTKIFTAQLSFLTSFLFIQLMSDVNTVDQVEKYRLKSQYLEEDASIFNGLLSAYYFHGLVSGCVNDNRKFENPSEVDSTELETNLFREVRKVHPFCELILNLKTEIVDKLEKYALGNTFRPGEPSYSSFMKDCRHFTKSVLSSQTTNELMRNLMAACDELNLYFTKGSRIHFDIPNGRLVTKQASSWLYSVNAFYKKVEQYSDALPDLAKPLLSSLSQIIYSVTTLNDLIKKYIVQIENGPLFTNFVEELIIFPNKIPIKGVTKEYLNRFLAEQFVLLLNKASKDGDGNSVADMERIQLLKMNLDELRMHCTALDKLDKTTALAVTSTLSEIVKVWEQQQRDIEKKKQDDEALYVTKSKCEDEDEEAIANEEIQQMFPSYSDIDFAEFKPNTLEQIPVKPQRTSENKTKVLISSQDVTLVYKWHSNLVRTMTSAEWLPARKKLVGNDVVSPFLQRYSTFSRVMTNAWKGLGGEFEGVLSPSFMVLLSQIKDKVDGEETSSKVDFYRSAWVSETKQCVPLLHRVKESTNNLLDQWPDFPTLKEIMVIVNRILGFPVTSPVSRFLTGLELLRDKIEEWNKNAHKGNNLIDVSLEVGQQIVNWRKLEMANWKECLNNLYHRKQSEAHKYWFYLYSVINSYLEKTEQNDTERVISVLRDFMEKSNLAEYEIRLDIIFVYHCHLIHFEQSEPRDELLAILWNTYNYYSQFNAQVASHIKEKRAPIEKKLRDFVKICTWDRDLSYWSVKDTVEKAHKALHKHTKEFENVLKESVGSCLVDNTAEVIGDHVGIWDRPKRATAAAAQAGGAYMIDVTNHIVLARNIKPIQKYLDEAEQPCKLVPGDSSLIVKVPSLLNKARTLCKDTISNTAYPAMVQALDDFVTTVIETSTHLGSLEVDASLPKEKQKSQAKNFVQQKRKALADLFKYLTKLGLNYRTGLVILSASDKDLYDFTIAPVDIEAAISYLKSRRCDASLSLLWSGCEKYFQKNIARHRTLTLALQQPHQDLGLQNIERCKGFAAQLLKLTNTQKKSIAKYSEHLCDLRTLTTSLMNILDINSSSVNLSTLFSKLDLLTECYANAGIILEQFNVLIKSCPEKGVNSESEPDFDCIISDSKIVRCYKNSDEWKDLYKKVKTLINNINKQKNALQKVASNVPKDVCLVKKNILVISQNHIDVAKDCVENLGNMLNDVELLINDYQLTFKVPIEDCKPQHPILRSLMELSTYLSATSVELKKLDTEKGDKLFEQMDSAPNDIIIRQTEDLIATMLLIIQSVYKNHLPQDTAENAEVLNAIDEIIRNDSKEESNDIVEDKHLKKHLEEKLSNDSKMLQLEALINKTQCLLLSYVSCITEDKDVDDVKSVVMRLVPILEQTVLFVQYFITQKVAVHRVSCKMLSVLLKIFSDLASKGFCKPSDLDMEEGEGEGGPGKLSGGMGLGDGEGQKDVSERIENQDQLDDAQRPGEEKNEENRDCKEEEKGVNMTDDFDSHLQDVEKKEGEESDKEDDNDDADKQMGDTDNAAEKLDQQIWGSEDEEELDEDQNQKKDKEEKGKGESTGEKEMAAKEQEQGTDDGADGKDKKEKKDINEMKEPEVDDDHVDPYHGNQQPMPEPEEFELPDNMDVDGEEAGDENEGETETENPFDVDVMKENIAEEDEQQGDKDDENKDNKAGLDVSSDEEGDGDDKEGDGDDKAGNEEDEGMEKDEENNTEKPDTTESMEEQDTEGGEKENPEEKEQPEESETPENEDKEELPKNPENINEEDEVEQKNQEANPQANPSNNDPTAEEDAEKAEMNRGTDDNVETNAEQQKDEEAAATEQSQEQVGEEKQSMGRSELDKSDKGHRGEKQAASRAERSHDKQKKRENKPAETDVERTLGDVNEKKRKQAQTLSVEKENETEEGADNDDDAEKEADAYQHVKEAKKDDLQAVDAATKEQADQQPTLQQEEDEEAETLKEDEQVPMDVDEEDIEVQKSEEIKPEKMKDGTDKEKEKTGNKKETGEEPTGETGMEVEGENVVTANVPRGTESSYHTGSADTRMEIEEMTLDTYMSIREWLSRPVVGAGVTAAVWGGLWRDAAHSARALCERLRLVLEPTGRSRRAGDFRTGRAINMRRVIPYIASHFRKDRIWLRRTKPAKREYKIAIAVDDSSSMSDNRSKELAFESLALVSQALNLLESGELAVLSFGEKPNLLHPFSEQFTEHSGSKILEHLRFEQTKTKIAQLLDFSTIMFEEQAMRSDAPNAKLLVIVSDGRGIFSEGETRVLQAVRRARQQGIFLVYVIIDNPDNKDSIMDIRRPVLDPVSNSFVRFESYLDTFPFPFYLILRDMSALPTVLGDAMRQWFELAANTS